MNKVILAAKKSAIYLTVFFFFFLSFTDLQCESVSIS